jgi:hypothetical protein
MLDIHAGTNAGTSWEVASSNASPGRQMTQAFQMTPSSAVAFAPTWRGLWQMCSPTRRGERRCQWA